jgi:MacB-like periplasmic core domain
VLARAAAGPPRWRERRRRGFTGADNETAAPVAIVNETFVKRFFKPEEDPLEQHFGMDLPENAGTFRIIGVVRDAKFAGFALNKPARPMVFVPLTQTVNYKNDLMKMIELRSHFMDGIMLTTNQLPGRGRIGEGTIRPLGSEPC